MKTENRNFRIGLSDYWPPDFYNQPLALFHNGKQVSIVGCGESDYIRLFRQGAETIVYCENDRLGYCAIEVFLGGEKVSEIFADGDTFESELSRYATITRAKILYSWAC